MSSGVFRRPSFIPFLSPARRRAGITGVSGGTTFTQTLGGSVGPTGTAIKRDMGRMIGGVASSGAVVRRDVSRSFSGVASSAGTLFSGRFVAFSAGVSPAGTLVRAIADRFVSGVTPAGALTRRTNLVRSGAVGAAGERTIRAIKALAGTVVSGGNGFVIVSGQTLVRFRDIAAVFLGRATNAAIFREVRSGAAFLLERVASFGERR